MSDDLHELRALLSLGTRAFGRSHEHHDVLGSTNDRAAAWILEGAPHGAVVTADAQTAGRGRRGRVWESPARENLYASVVLRPDVVRADFGAIGLAVAVGLADGLPIDVELKWPNDLLVGGCKLGGILCESRWVGARPDVVVGFGINVHQREFAGELADVATSLALCDAALPRAELLAQVLLSLEEALDRFVDVGFGAIRSAYTRRCSMLGRTVDVSGPDGKLRGVADGLADDGALLLRPEGGGPVQRIEVAEVVRG
jgi:BirA family biotin operon repressor/biotin-[acetyl-CoA-carboxylase] ligase